MGSLELPLPSCCTLQWFIPSYWNLGSVCLPICQSKYFLTWTNWAFAVYWVCTCIHTPPDPRTELRASNMQHHSLRAVKDAFNCWQIWREFLHCVQITQKLRCGTDGRYMVNFLRNWHTFLEGGGCVWDNYSCPAVIWGFRCLSLHRSLE